MVFNEVKDSGKRQQFPTGSVRDIQVGKGRYDLISPIVLSRLAKHYENGSAKYGDRNWEKGQPLGRYVDSAFRHLNKFLEGHRDEDHPAAVIWNVGALIHTEEMIRRGALPSNLNDLPDYVEKPKVGTNEGPVKVPSAPAGPGEIVESGPGWFWCKMPDGMYDLQNADRTKYFRWRWRKYGGDANEIGAFGNALSEALKEAGLTR